MWNIVYSFFLCYIYSVFFGPGFVTVTKEENIEWELINQDIINIFDKL